VPIVQNPSRPFNFPIHHPKIGGRNEQRKLVVEFDDFEHNMDR